MGEQPSVLEILAKSKHKAGDKVKIRKDLSDRKQYGAGSCNDYMVEFAGQEATIDYVCICGDGYIMYTLIGAGSWEWLWTDEMFED